MYLTHSLGSVDGGGDFWGLGKTITRGEEPVEGKEDPGLKWQPASVDVIWGCVTDHRTSHDILSVSDC